MNLRLSQGAPPPCASTSRGRSGGPPYGCQGYGASGYIAPNSTAAGRAQNRRVGCTSCVAGAGGRRYVLLPPCSARWCSCSRGDRRRAGSPCCGAATAPHAAARRRPPRSSAPRSRHRVVLGFEPGDDRSSPTGRHSSATTRPSLRRAIACGIASLGRSTLGAPLIAARDLEPQNLRALDRYRELHEARGPRGFRRAKEAEDVLRGGRRRARHVGHPLDARSAGT